MKSLMYRLVLLLIVLCSFSSAAQQESSELDALIEQISDARRIGDMDLADDLTTKLTTLAQQRMLPVYIARGQYQLARNAMERNQYEQAQQYLQQAIVGFQGSANKADLGHAYRQLGLTYRYQSNYSLALEYIYLAMQLYQQLGNKDQISSTYNSIGVVLEKMGQYEEASQAHQQALQLNYELNDQEGIASALYNLGDIRRTMGDLETALSYFNDALKLDIASGDTKNIAYSHHKIGYVLMTMGQLDTAREHILEALERFQSIQSPRDTDWAYTSLAELEMKLGNYALAEQLIQGVIERAIENKYNSLLVDAYAAAAELAFAQKDYAKALLMIEAGIAQAQQNKERSHEAGFEKLRVEVHLANNSLQQAFEALQRQKQLDDEVLNTQRIDAIAKLQAQTEFVRRANQIELLEKEKALQQAQLREHELSRNLWIILVAAVLVLIFLLINRRSQRLANQRLQQEVALRTKELKDKNNELEQAYADMEAISLTDKLTGIHNRRFLEEQITSDLEHSLRQYQEWLSSGGSTPHQADIIVFMIDMDDFKQINDHYGHNVGDRVLVQLTQRLQQVLRHADYLVRWGGEEFVAVARFTARGDAVQLAQRMTDVVNTTPFELNTHTSASLTCSVGFACFPLCQHAAHLEWEGLIGLADACLYYAKQAGKNTWCGALSAEVDAKTLTSLTPDQLQQLASKQQIELISPTQTKTPS